MNNSEELVGVHEINQDKDNVSTNDSGEATLESALTKLKATDNEAARRSARKRTRKRDISYLYEGIPSSSDSDNSDQNDHNYHDSTEIDTDEDENNQHSSRHILPQLKEKITRKNKTKVKNTAEKKGKVTKVKK